MKTYLERYVQGEHKQVWNELTGFGADIHDEPLYTDALAVAHETMRRARFNIEVLIQRLGNLGYQFGPYYWDNPENVNFNPIAVYTKPFSPPAHNVIEQLHEVEHFAGSLPLSVRSWYEHIGSVNFIGYYPVPDPSDPEGFTNWVQYSATLPHPGTPNWKDESDVALEIYDPFYHDLDPLYIAPIENTLAFWRKLAPDSRKSIMTLAEDEFYKYGVSGSSSYGIMLPNAMIDAPLLDEWHETTFVDYLRIFFQWGGFPGLVCKKRPPKSELDYLTNGLLEL